MSPYELTVQNTPVDAASVTDERGQLSSPPPFDHDDSELEEHDEFRDPDEDADEAEWEALAQEVKLLHVAWCRDYLDLCDYAEQIRSSGLFAELCDELLEGTDLLSTDPHERETQLEYLATPLENATRLPMGTRMDHYVLEIAQDDQRELSPDKALARVAYDADGEPYLITTPVAIYAALRFDGDMDAATDRIYDTHPELQMPRGAYSNDTDNADMLVNALTDKLRWDARRKCWMAWTGTHWEEDHGAAAVPLAQGVLQERLGSLGALRDRYSLYRPKWTKQLEVRWMHSAVAAATNPFPEQGGDSEDAAADGEGMDGQSANIASQGIRDTPDTRLNVDDGQRTDLIEKLTKRLGRTPTITELAEADLEKRISDESKWISKSLNRRQLDDALKLAAPHMIFRHDEADADPYLLNCLNGTLNLKTGKLSRHKPSDMITKVTSVVYDPDAPAEEWERFIAAVTADGDGASRPELVDYLQQMLGYCISGSVDEQKLFVLYGQGGNGKSQVLEATNSILNHYAGPANAAVVMERRASGINNDEVAKAVGLRLAIVSETAKNCKLNEDRVKHLTGETETEVTEKFRSPRNEAVRCKVVVMTNDLPHLSGTDEGMRRRIVVIPFDQSFHNSSKRVAHYGAALAAKEGPGILAWLVRGFRKWHEAGRLNEPACVTGAARSYFSEFDKVGRFLEDVTEPSESHDEPLDLVFEVFREWLGREGLSTNYSKDVFSKQLQAKDYIVKRESRGGLRERRCLGLQLHSAHPAFQAVCDNGHNTPVVRRRSVVKDNNVNRIRKEAAQRLLDSKKLNN